MIQRLWLKNQVFPHIQTLLCTTRFYPRKVTFEPTNLCNLECPLCHHKGLTRKKKYASFEDFRRMIDQLKGIKRIQLNFMGESFLHPRIFDMIKYCEGKGISSSISTNSTLLHLQAQKIVESGLSLIHLSFDGMSQETLEQYRSKADFQQVSDGLKMLCKEKTRVNSKKPFIKVRFLVFKHNEHEILKFLKFVDRLRVNRVSLISPTINYPPVSKWLSTKKQFQRYNDDGTVKEPLTFCTWVWDAIITCEGDLVPCCLDWDAKIKLGNVFQRSFFEIYWSETYRKTRLKMARQTLPYCKDCYHSRISDEMLVKLSGFHRTMEHHV